MIDFGLSREIAEHEELTGVAGTIYTMAPEVLQGHHSKPADLWSVGVVAYMLMSSQVRLEDHASICVLTVYPNILVPAC